MDSSLYRVDENIMASTFSLNKIPERGLDTGLSQSVQSIPLYLMPRPNSVAGEKIVRVASWRVLALLLYCIMFKVEWGSAVLASHCVCA